MLLDLFTDASRDALPVDKRNAGIKSGVMDWFKIVELRQAVSE